VSVQQDNINSSQSLGHLQNREFDLISFAYPVSLQPIAKVTSVNVGIRTTVVALHEAVVFGVIESLDMTFYSLVHTLPSKRIGSVSSH
jgi:hypothetical protein